MAKPHKAKSASNGGANLGFEAKLWAAAARWQFSGIRLARDTA